MGGDGLGVDRIRLDPSPGVRLVVAGPLERRSRGPGPRPRAALVPAVRWAIGPSASRACVFCSISRAAASRRRGQRLGRLLADEPVELRGEPLDPGDVLLLGGRAVPRPRRGPRGRCPASCWRGVRLACLSSCSISERPAQAAVDLDVAELGLHPVVSAQPQRDEREDEADPGNRPADQLRRRAEVEDPGEPADERRARRGRRPAARDRWRSATAAARSARAGPRTGPRPRPTGRPSARGSVASSLRSRPTTCSSTGSGFGEGWLVWSAGQLVRRS